MSAEQMNVPDMLEFLQFMNDLKVNFNKLAVRCGGFDFCDNIFLTSLFFLLI
jgi:hypothetical protein